MIAVKLIIGSNEANVLDLAKREGYTLQGNLVKAGNHGSAFHRFDEVGVICDNGLLPSQFVGMEPENWKGVAALGVRYY